MMCYSPDAEPDTERLLHIQYVNKYNDDSYGRIQATVVRRARADRADPDREGSMIYEDGVHATGYRNCSWASGKKNALFVEDFTVSGQFDLKTDKEVYGSDIGYYAYKVEARDAEQMIRTFKHVQKKMDEYYHDFGHAADYHDFLKRVAKALGIKRFVVYTNSHDSLLSSGNTREFDATSVAYNVEKLVEQARAGKAR